MPYLGEITSLLAAMCWTVSSTAFAVASRAASPLAANQFRLYASLPLLVVLKRLPANLRPLVEKQSTIHILKSIRNGLQWELAPLLDVHLSTKVSTRFQIFVKHL